MTRQVTWTLISKFRNLNETEWTERIMRGLSLTETRAKQLAARWNEENKDCPNGPRYIAVVNIPGQHRE